MARNWIEFRVGAGEIRVVLSSFVLSDVTSKNHVDNNVMWSNLFLSLSFPPSVFFFRFSRDRSAILLPRVGARAFVGAIYFSTKKICNSADRSRKDQPLWSWDRYPHMRERARGKDGPCGITGSDGDPMVNRGNHGNLANWQIELESSPFSRPCLVCLGGGSRGIELGVRRPHVYDRDIFRPRSW